MNLLPSSTVRLIASSQVITSVSSVVKELIENSLDAGASSIEVKLERWGLDRIEVRDNGCGIKPEDAPFMAQPHYTSKISNDTDLKSLQTYGFRGEALGSLSSVSNVSILTKTASEEVGMHYTLEHNGKIGATQPKPTTTGTTITATNLFKNLPVRKQFSSNSKKCKDELKRVEDLVMAYALIHPTLRITLRHNKAVVWQKSKVVDQRTALLSVFGTSLLAQMGAVQHHDKSSGIDIVGYFPRPGCDLEITGRAVNDRCFVFVNGRPVNMKQISQLIKQYYNKQTSVTSNRYPVAFLSVNIPPSFVDVNLEPNKTSVMLTNKDEVMTVLTNLIEEFYSDEKNRLRSNDNTDCNNVGEKRNTVLSKLGDVTNTCSLNGEVASCTSLSTGKKRNVQKTPLHLNRISVLEDTQPQVIVEGEAEQTFDEEEMSLFDNSSVGKNSLTNKNGLMTVESSCPEGTIPAIQVKDSSSSLVVTKTAKTDQHCCLRSSLQDDASRLSPVDSVQSVELCETMSNKTLCETSESTSHFKDFCNSSKESRDSRVVENVNCGIHNSLSNLNNEKSTAQNTNEIDTNITPQVNQAEGLSNNTSLACTPTKRSSLENLFSLDMDDLFEDSDFDLSGIDSNLKTPGISNNEFNSEKAPSAELPSSAFDQGLSLGTVPSVKSSLTVTASSGATEAPFSDKEWSMGHGIVDKQGNLVQPVSLVTPGPPRQISLTKTPVTHAPLHRKRKHSSDQEKSRLSLSTKKIKKIPEITNQPLINNVMSPNPLQRKLLFKKTEIPFSLSELKESVKRKTELRSVEVSSSDHLIGRLDPWGVWLLRRGPDLVCANQYRIQEKLLFKRLMACHSLPKEQLNHSISLNERSVGGPDCWKTLCNMSSKCDPPDTTRYVLRLP